KLYINNKEDEIIKEINQLEDDKRFFFFIEEEIIDRIKEFDESKKKFEDEKKIFKHLIDESIQSLKDKEYEINQHVKENLIKLKNKRKEFFDEKKKEKNEIKKIQKELNKFEKELIKKENKINLIKELKEDKKKLNKDYKDLYVKFSNLTKDYFNGMNLIEKEKELIKLRDDLLNKEKELEQKNKKLLSRKHLIDELEYNHYLKSKGKDKGLIPVHKQIKPNISREDYSIDIFDLIKETKSLLNNGEINQIKENLEQIKRLHSQLQLSNYQKSSVYYDILEIENTLELSNLH
ncbi:MAG: hypothetical protein ACMXX8_02380, partial [Candidatus Woesearchaeota archaeon]